MENKYLQILIKISDLLEKQIDANELAEGVKQFLQEIVAVKNLYIYVFDNITNTIRNAAEGWSVIPDDSGVYKAFSDIKNEDFIINSRAYKMPAHIGDITFKLESLFIPTAKDGQDFGLIEIDFEDNTPVNTEFLF